MEEGGNVWVEMGSKGFVVGLTLCKWREKLITEGYQKCGDDKLIPTNWSMIGRTF